MTQATSFAMAPKEGSVCTLVDCALSGEFKIDLDNMEAPRKGDWTNYLKGALVELRRRGVRFGAFRCGAQEHSPAVRGNEQFRRAGNGILFCSQDDLRH